MWFLLLIFILLKIMVFHKLNKMMNMGPNDHRVCPAGYHGFNADPFDCNGYYMCPHAIHFLCQPQEQFDLDTQTCQPVDLFLETGCVGRLNRNLLL
ncbi:ORF14 [Leucania separata nucleopolyhedrovirus]|uniref:ORF14 n=1 Tax=Leucania separata nucleopolyhedrovirus TaxID=1307956 RepID=Q0ILA5_NPVLS|nr:ORF14 [Leucania separata nucleopolyhedrovirus]AAR28778.1 ORF14 [Leucania separata nucleopolyhedrovirus]